MTYLRKTNGLVRSIYLAIAGIALVFWVFGIGTNDGDDSKSGGGLVPRANADTPHTCSTCDSSACSSGASSSADGGGESCGCTGCCFLPNAKVAVENGEVAIADLKVGDKVVSYDEATGAFGLSTIEKVVIHNKETGDEHDFINHPLMKITADNGQELIVTSNHPILDATLKTYRSVAEFVIGDKLMTKDGEVAIAAIEKLDETQYESQTVYNLTLTDGPHTYMVDKVVVHNKDSSGTCL